MTISEAVREKTFITICLMDFLTILPLIYMAGTYKAMGIQLGGYDDLTLTSIGSLGTVANGLFRIIWGAIYDKFGFTTSYRIILLAELIVCALIVKTAELNAYFYAIWIFLGFQSLGAHFVLFPLALIKAYGQ